MTKPEKSSLNLSETTDKQSITINMERNPQNINDQDIILDYTRAVPANFLSNVFSYMALALIISAVMAFWWASSGMVYSLFSESGHSLLGWVVMLSPLGFILAMNFGLQRFSQPVLLIMFISFAAMMGISLSYIFLVYSIGSIGVTFGVTAATFGTMAVLGYTTKTDLTKFGSILLMGLIGIIIASLINWFVGSAKLDYIISILGVLIFTGLTAYDVQRLKRIGAGIEYGSEAAGKLAILGATSLYLNFINLFLFLLRFLGNRD
jgi:uncharacterized protein